jgi:hypothetical protein
MQVLLNVPVGQVSCAALTQRSQRPLLMLMVAPASTAASENLDEPDTPVVEAGLPPQNSMLPAMPPQMDRMATLVLCVTSLLFCYRVSVRTNLFSCCMGCVRILVDAFGASDLAAGDDLSGSGPGREGEEGNDGGSCGEMHGASGSSRRIDFPDFVRLFEIRSMAFLQIDRLISVYAADYAFE